MRTQPAWLDKLHQLPDEIFSRLMLNEIKMEAEKPVRCFLAGLGWESALGRLEKLSGQINWPKTKVFVTDPSAPAGRNLKSSDTFDSVILPGNFEEKLAAFPEATFDLMILLWNPPVNKPQETMKLVYQTLKKNGQFAVVTPWESSPEVPLTILKKVLKQNRPLKLQLYKSGLPATPRQLRKMLEKSRFKDIRVWSDSVPLNHPSPGDIFDDLLEMSGGGLFQKEIGEPTRFFIRGEFIKLFASLPQKTTEEIQVNYNFGGAVGFK